MVVLPDVTTHMTDESLTKTFVKVLRGWGLKISARFSSRITHIRWVFDKHHLYIVVSAIYDVVSERTMIELAKWVSKCISGERVFDGVLFSKLKKEIQPNKDRYHRILGVRTDIDDQRLIGSIMRLIKEGYIEYNLISDIDLYWIEPKSKCIGTCSYFFDEVMVSTKLSVEKVPLYVIDYILYCNCMILAQKDWKKESDKFDKKKSAVEWLNKNIGFDVDEAYSIPTLEIIK